MEIIVFLKYKVKRECKFSYISDRIGDEYFYTDDTSVFEKVMQGGELLDLIADDVKHQNTIFLSTKEDCVYIQQFNPNTGEPNDIEITFEVVKNE